MNWVGAMEGGVTGTAALKVLQETLHKLDGNAPRPFLHSPGSGKKANRKKGKAKRHMKQAGEVLFNVLYFGIPTLSEKSKAPLWGGVMGAAAGLWNAFGKRQKGGGKRKMKTRWKLYNLFLYTTAGVLAGEAIKHLPPKAKKQPLPRKKREEAEPEKAAQQAEAKLLSTILYIDEVPLGYQIQKEENMLSFAPSEYSAKECCPPRFAVVQDGDSLLFEPATLAPDLQKQVIQELRTMEAGKLLQ